MKAETVFEVYKALSQIEQNNHYDLVQADYNSKYNAINSKRKPAPILSDSDAIRYLLENVFNKSKEL